MTLNSNRHEGSGDRAVSGYLCAVLAAGLWGISGTLAKSLFIAGVTPFQLVQLRTTIGAAGLFIFLILWSRDSLIVRGRDLPALALLGLSIAASQAGYLFAISRIKVAAAVLLQYQAPALIALHAVFFMHRRLSKLTVAAITATVVGCYLMAGAYSQGIFSMDRAGILAGLGSALAYAMYSVESGKVMQRYGAVTVVFYAFVFAAVLWNILQPPFGAFTVRYETGTWTKVMLIGVFGTIFPFALYTEAIRRVGATRTSITSTMEPVVAGVASYFYLGEALGPVQITGAVLILSAVMILQLRRPGLNEA